jgi:uncharacterized protein (TIGR03437 family)
MMWIILLAAGVADAQLSSSAYRTLGQQDFRQNGMNLVQGVELYSPVGVALDARNSQTHIYISDTGNSRILGWQDASAYQIGDAPAVVLGQPGPQYSAPFGIGSSGFNGVTGIAVDPATGNLYAADTVNNRVLRFASPFTNPVCTRQGAPATCSLNPDAVYGQPGFGARASGTTNNSLNQPHGVAVDAAGNLWIADTGNNRIVRYPASVLNSPTQPVADLVLGQKDLVSGTANAGGQVSASGFDAPTALVFDAQGNLYVSDYNNTRVLRFAAPLTPNEPATAVWGQSNFASRGVPQQASATTLAGPISIAVANGNLYVAVPHDNRVLVFPTATTTGAAATGVFAQTDFTSTTANAGAAPLASPSTLNQPYDVKIDGAGNVFIVDSGNNRVLRFPAGTKTASTVWGQSDFISNGINQIKPTSINYPYHMAIDYSSAPFALYISDPGNNRILVWKDSARFRTGDPADMVIGQPNLRTAAPNVDSQGSGKPTQTSLSAPEGIAVNPNDGTLFVADAGNNRVLRYPRPVAQAGRITPDAVIGQADFTSSDSALVSAVSLKSPGGVAIGPNGDLFVADGGNNRVLEYGPGAGSGAMAIRVYGQPGMFSSVRPSQVSAQTLSVPQGIAVDPASNLYVADAGANRVVIFSNTQNAPAAGTPATFVLGQPDFASATTAQMKQPNDVAVDSAGNLYVSDGGNNRVLIYSSLVFLPQSGAAPSGVVGQQSAKGNAANWDSPDGLATADGLYAPAGVYVDRQDTLYVGDAGNNRVMQFLKAGIVVNAATQQSSVPVAQGALATLYGGALASDKMSSTTPPWSTTLVNRQVVINDDVAAPLNFVGPGQVNFQMPSNAPLGTVRVAVRVGDTGELVAGGSMVAAAVAPGLFTMNQAGTGQAAATNPDGTINGPNNPATAGSTIVLYGTGQGQVSPSVADGTAAPSAPPAQTIAVPTSSGSTCLNSQPSMCVAVGGTGFGGIQYSGLTPGSVGLWQINMTIPIGTPAGAAVPVRVVINGTPSNTVTVAVR